MAKQEEAPRALKLKVTLHGIRPPIWRRILVPESLTLFDLHTVIQVVFGWHDCHLHDFEVAKRRYGCPGLLENVDDEDAFELKRLRTRRIKRIVYTYDFGDTWTHVITNEGAQTMEPGRSYPACIAGRRNGPPEDIGGVWGYADLVAFVADPTNPELADMAEIFGDDFEFDPARFDLAETQAALERRFPASKTR